MDIQVLHDSEKCKFYFLHDGEESHLEYALREGGLIDLYHTYVPPAIRGQGVAEALVLASIAFAREKGLKVLPSCGYVSRYFDRHPEYCDCLGKGFYTGPSCRLP